MTYLEFCGNGSHIACAHNHLDQYHLLYLYDVIPKFHDGHIDSIFCL